MGKIIIPSSRPKLTREESLSLVGFRSLMVKNPSVANSPLIVLGIRNYYRRSMGNDIGNDFGIYDDAVVIISQSKEHPFYSTFNYNTDPSKYGVGIAQLATGIWWYQQKVHKGQYAAFGQASAVLVHRSGQADERGWFGIDIHKGGDRSTWSLGCQTVPASQWLEFKYNLYRLMDQLKLKTFPYVLVDNSLNSVPV